MNHHIIQEHREGQIMDDLETGILKLEHEDDFGGVNEQVFESNESELISNVLKEVEDIKRDLIDEVDPCYILPNITENNLNKTSRGKGSSKDALQSIDILNPLFKWSKFAEKVDDSLENGEAVYKCTICEFKASRNSLYYHIRVHHRKNYKCQICEYKACEKNILKQHVKAKHNKVKDYTCSQCNFKSSYNRSLTQHMRFAKH